METEYEVRILDIDKEEIIQKLEQIKAKKIGTYFQRRYVYDFHPEVKGKWIRLRTNGERTTFTIKDRFNPCVIGGVNELEIEVEDFDKMNQMLEELGYIAKTYQENKRETYKVEDAEFDIDSWPMIPTYLEIEGKNQESVEKYIDLLGLKEKTITLEGCTDIYQRYGYDLHSYQKLTFEEEQV